MRAQTDQTVQEKSERLEAVDAALLDTLRRRIELAREIGDARVNAGYPRTTHADEVALIRKFSQLGASGVELGSILLRLSRSDSAEKRASD